jgi:broad specificity phosphatase PhoE
MIRHGNAPGPSLGQGDPAGFKLEDCRTQRNLDEQGRAQSRALGKAFREHGVPVRRILSSPWCRCLETADLMAVGRVERADDLVPSGPRVPRAAAALDKLKERVASWRGPGTLVLVTHGFTIQALTGVVLSQAETVVLKPTPASASAAQVVGRIPAPR